MAVLRQHRRGFTTAQDNPNICIYNIPLHRGCAEQSVRVAEDNGTMSPRAGRQGNTLGLLHRGGWVAGRVSKSRC